MGPGKHVIVGGLGNLGRHMQRALVSKGIPTCVIDRGVAARHNNKGNNNGGSALLLEKSVEFYSHQLGVDSPMLLTKELKRINNIDTVYSMVTPDVQHGTKNEFVTTNEIGIRDLVNACKEAGVNKLVYVSSMAVTNHFIPSINQNENDPLPDLDTYVTSYDMTKRNGEQIVLDANEPNILHTCALRIGSVLAGATDYNFRYMLYESPTAPGRIITVPSQQRFDHISARDVCKAMICASDKLNESYSNNNSATVVPGRALFVSKSANNIAPKINEIAFKTSELLNWPITTIPPFLFSLIQNGTKIQDAILDYTTSSRPGIPPHLFMDIANYEQTFDNSLARKLLNFEPDETWEDAVEWIVEEYHQRKQN